jgi:hypothetical protein
MGLALLLAALTALVAALLLELSRTLAERARGRWYAGNGRDIFHAGAVAALFGGLFAVGLPLALCGAAAAVICAPPLLVLDNLPRRRAVRLGALVAMVVLALGPAVLAPRAMADAANALARVAFPLRR